MYSHRLWQPSQRLQGIQGGAQQWRVVAAGRGRQRPQGYAFPVHHRRALEATFAAIHRAFARFLSPAWSLRYAAIDGHIRELETDGSVVGFARR